MGLPRWLSCKESTCQSMRCRFDPWSGRSLEKGMATHFSILAWIFHGQRSLLGYSLRGHRQTLSDFHFTHTKKWGSRNRLKSLFQDLARFINITTYFQSSKGIRKSLPLSPSVSLRTYFKRLYRSFSKVHWQNPSFAEQWSQENLNQLSNIPKQKWFWSHEPGLCPKQEYRYSYFISRF